MSVKAVGRDRRSPGVKRAGRRISRPLRRPTRRPLRYFIVSTVGDQDEQDRMVEWGECNIKRTDEAEPPWGSYDEEWTIVLVVS
jgi:hypothetical protein